MKKRGILLHQKEQIQAWLDLTEDTYRKGICPFTPNLFIRKYKCSLCIDWFPRVKDFAVYPSPASGCPCNCYSIVHVRKVAKEMLKS